MAEIKSFIRKTLKPVLFKMLREDQYLWFQYIAKVKDVEKRLVEEDDMVLLPLILKQDSVSFDIGANYAYYTVRLAKLAPLGKVYALEPIPPTFKVCNKIIKHYKLENVVLLEAGAGAQNSTVEFKVPVQDSGFISGGQGHISGRHNELSERKIYYPWSKERVFQCRVISIDQEFPDLNKLDFIKMDIEGAELYALKGMMNTLIRLRPFILIEICKFWLSGFGIKAKEIQEFMFDIKYGIYRYCRNNKSLLKVDNLEQDEKYNYIDKINLTPYAPNYFLIPSEQEVEIRRINDGLSRL